MQRLGDFLRFLIALALWSVWPGTAVIAQAPPLEPDEPSPATRHAQVVAHGVAAMPADEIAWRLAVDRAVPPTRADAQERPAGFILANKGVIALVDQDGQRLARIAPGEAIWIEPGAARAVVGLERKAPDYYDIALVAATEIAEGDTGVTGGTPFLAPTGDAFDIDLIRDVLNRAEESIVSTGPSPALLLVTNGTVFLESSSGLAQMSAGEAVQVVGDVVISGASRAPAAFVVARIGPEVPARVVLEAATPLATPGPLATPVTIPGSASIAISMSVCPVADPDSADVPVCTAPASGMELSAIKDGEEIASSVVSDAGDLAFMELDPGDYSLGAEIPGDIVSAWVRCRSDSGDDVVERAETNQVVVSLAAGDDVACSWSIVLDDAGDEVPLTPIVPATDEVDSDEDGLTDGREAGLGTDPFLPDSDADGVGDGDEIDFYGTDALAADTDADGLNDSEELLIHGTNPLLADTDGDGVSDGEEITAGSAPLDAASVPATPAPIPTATPEPTRAPALAATPALQATPAVLDGEGNLAVAIETESELEERAEPTDDLDGDGLTTVDEITIHGTNVIVADSDGDGVSDGDEVAAGTDPLDSSDR